MTVVVKKIVSVEVDLNDLSQEELIDLAMEYLPMRSIFRVRDDLFPRDLLIALLQNAISTMEEGVL